jgi:hypothetical protein
MEPTVIIGVDLDEDDYEDVLIHEWRAEQLRRLGVPRTLADTFAQLVDWHEVANLVERGCAPRIALRIVR